MRHSIYIWCLILSCGLSSFSYAQKAKLHSVEMQYDKFAYIKSSEILLKVAEKGYKSVELFQKLGNSFYFNNKMKDASKWYEKLMLLNEDIDPEYYFRYAQALKFIENYDMADIWMGKFHEVKSEDSRGLAFINNVDYLSEIENNSNPNLELYNLDINTEFSDFGTAQYQDKIIFASTRGDGRIYKWNEQPYLDLYTAQKQNDGSYADVSSIDGNINSKYHESSVTITPDNQTLFFTRNNYYKRKYKSDENRINRLKLFRAKLQPDGSWGDIASVHFNNDEYSVAHPTVNIDGTKLYFASDMTGTLGLSDLYVVEINSDGSLGEPINLGISVNSEGQETFPFINPEGDLYFSSNGYSGLGGLDVYVIRDFEGKIERSEPFDIKNMGKPINSAQDDFGYFENLETKKGYISSNRPNGKGDDDIYSFNILKCEQLLEGVVKDEKTQELLANVIVILYDEAGEELQQLVVGNDAAFKFELECDKEYFVRAQKQTYTSDEKRYTTPKIKQELQLELFLLKDEQEIKVGDDLAKVLDIPMIYFDFDKYNIRYDAVIELQKILAVMSEYPTMVVDIRSHTDCRGSYNYNESLSDNRAKSTRQYLISKGIAPSRLTAKGYGEYQLINNCACEGQQNVYCSEEDHQLNRRSEFIIVKM